MKEAAEEGWLEEENRAFSALLASHPKDEVIAWVHWNNAPSSRPQIAEAMERLFTVGLPYIREPRIETRTTTQPWDDARWRRTKTKIATGRLTALALIDWNGGFRVSLRTGADAPVGTIALRWPRVRGYPSLEPYFDRPECPAVQASLVSAMTSIFLELGPCYALMLLTDPDRGLSGNSGYTELEEREALPSVTLPEEMQRPERVTAWARGVGWGNFLGTAHVERLGGTNRVIQDAPCYRAERLSEGGVYLQATESLWDLQREQLVPLESFLRPILPTRAEIEGPVKPDPAALARRLHLLAGGDYEPVPLPRRRVGPYQPAFLVVESGHNGLADWPDVVFALHPHGEPGPELVAAVTRLLDAWYEEGFRGAFGGRGFHWLSNVEVEDGAITWQIDLGDASIDAYFDLLQRLDAFQGERKIISKLQVGVEELSAPN